jgi:hypothetical protein
MTHSTNELPFPWRCGRCGQQSVERATVPYSTEVQYDDLGYTVEVPEFEVPRCKNCGAMVLDDRADDQITDALRRLVGLPRDQGPSKHGLGGVWNTACRAASPPSSRVRAVNGRVSAPNKTGTGTSKTRSQSPFC